eukprot:TRINITY_DN62748_c0_g1_i1.p1 TRINITY_DN62748_c0_g1~~TRINITY_DN62748_c0_g1_i1.p1  ORF type:complete len:440 (-),score=38.17 TRINITY_DN62748_c0_g1_i1:102-1340(-)
MSKFEGFSGDICARPALLKSFIELQRQVERPVDDAAAIREGDSVTLHGLTSAPALNGCVGVVLRRNDDGTRWIVRLETQGKELSVKAQGLSKNALANAAGCQGDTPSGSDVWECSAANSDALRMIGRARPVRDDVHQCKMVIEVACRGSKNIDNWFTNFDAQLAACDVGLKLGRVHKGFQLAYMSLRESMWIRIRENMESFGVAESDSILLYVVGYSLGGALATLAAYDLAAASGHHVCCVTWGCPRVGDSDFAVSYRSAVPSTARFVNVADPVPRVPSNPNDPYDDGALFGSERLLDLIQRGQTAISANEFVHVCRGANLGSLNVFDHALASVNAGLDEGATSALQRILRIHKFSAYADSLMNIMDGKDDATQNSASTYDAVQTAQRAVGAVVGGLGKTFSAFQRSRASNP